MLVLPLFFAGHNLVMFPEGGTVGLELYIPVRKRRAKIRLRALDDNVLGWTKEYVPRSRDNGVTWRIGRLCSECLLMNDELAV